MTPEEFETAWVPVPLAWRHIGPNDVIVGKNGMPWLVLATLSGAALHVKIRRDDVTEWRGQVDPDETVQVLTPWPMAQAVALTRDELGARLLARRTTEAGAA